MSLLGSDEPVSFVLLEGGTRARSATGGLTKIVGHHELRWRGLARRTNGGTGVRQESVFSAVIDSAPPAAHFAGQTPSPLEPGFAFPGNVRKG
jgi:hypothetical protein